MSHVEMLHVGLEKGQPRRDTRVIISTKHVLAFCQVHVYIAPDIQVWLSAESSAVQVSCDARKVFCLTQ